MIADNRLDTLGLEQKRLALPALTGKVARKDEIIGQQRQEAVFAQPHYQRACACWVQRCPLRQGSSITSVMPGVWIGNVRCGRSSR